MMISPPDGNVVGGNELYVQLAASLQLPVPLNTYTLDGCRGNCYMDDTREFRAKGDPLAQGLSACDDNPLWKIQGFSF